MNFNKLLVLISFFNLCCFNNSFSSTISTEDTSGISNYSLLRLSEDLTKDDYNNLLDSLMKYNAINFFRLRMAYTKTKDYIPYSVKEDDLFKEVYAKLDSSNYVEANNILEKIYKTNYVNLKAHLISGYIYKKLNDTAKSNFHYGIYDGLMHSIVESGDGKKPETAFIVISTKEEYDLLNEFEMRSSEQSLVNHDKHSFDLLKAVEVKTKKEYDIYFNIDMQMDHFGKEYRGKNK